MQAEFSGAYRLLRDIHEKTAAITGGIMKREKTNKSGKPRRQAAVAKREFTVNETYSGTLKLADIFSDLICAGYCRKERKNLRERDG
jgi:hypothetical protein